MKLSEHFVVICDHHDHHVSTKSFAIHCQLISLTSGMMEADDPRSMPEEISAKGFMKGYFFSIEGEIVNI